MLAAEGGKAAREKDDALAVLVVHSSAHDVARCVAAVRQQRRAVRATVNAAILAVVAVAVPHEPARHTASKMIRA